MTDPREAEGRMPDAVVTVDDRVYGWAVAFQHVRRALGLPTVTERYAARRSPDTRQEDGT